MLGSSDDNVPRQLGAQNATQRAVARPSPSSRSTESASAGLPTATDEERRLAAAAAAENRVQAVSGSQSPMWRLHVGLTLNRLQASQRGTSASNPNQGKLAAQLESQNKKPPLPPQREEKGLVVSRYSGAFVLLLTTIPLSGTDFYGCRSWPLTSPLSSFLHLFRSYPAGRTLDIGMRIPYI